MVSAYNRAQIFWRDVNEEQSIILKYCPGPVSAKYVGAVPASYQSMPGHNHTSHPLLNVCPGDTLDSGNRKVIKQQRGLCLCVSPASQVFAGCFLSVASVMQSIVGTAKPKQALLNYLKTLI